MQYKHINKNNMETNSIDIRHKVKLLRLAVMGKYPAIAKRANCSVSTVSRVLNHEWVDQNVIAAAIEVRDETQADQAKADENLEQLMQKI